MHYAMGIRHGEFIAKNVQDDILAHLPDSASGQYEWIDGRIREVSEPMPGHGLVCTNVTARLYTYVEKHKLGTVFSADTLFLLKEQPRNVRAPDVAFVDKSRALPRIDGVWFISPDLVVEVQSKSQRGKFMRRKAADYLEAGVRLVWVVDPRTRTAIRYRKGEEPVTLEENDVLNGEDVVPGFECPVTELLPPPGTYLGS